MPTPNYWLMHIDSERYDLKKDGKPLSVTTPFLSSPPAPHYVWLSIINLSIK
jgi:hypothetical protein